MTVPSWEWEYENAPKPSCHSNRPATQRSLLMKPEAPDYTLPTISDSAMSGFKPLRRWSLIRKGDIARFRDARFSVHWS